MGSLKLIIAIIQDEYITKVIRTLMENKIRTTKLSSTGGFLKSGNTTLFIGVEDNKVDEVVELIRKECSSKKVKSGNDEITVGGANLFVMDIDKYMKI
ncbi:cyclic-di-AMP receptor [Tissierella praeacuta]|uniref:cyclic-di-AMP receptor n=1 Tax=Tissierella praeacuta TaxID=43131 RepID=UPI001FECCFA5|nr:cyclic-di-AMP receptor [Tissierella praeacuta]